MIVPASPREPAALLAAVLPPLRDGETYTTRCIKDGKVLEAFHASIPDLLLGVQHRVDDFHIYYGQAPRVGRNGTAAGVPRVGALWADVDAKLWAGEPDSKAAALRAIEGFPLPLTAIVDSGGGFYPYLALSEPWDVSIEEGRRRFEALNAAFARAVCGRDKKPDHVQDVSRILRLPGTCNHKYAPARPVRILHCAPSVRYSLAHVEACFKERYSWALRTEQNAPALPREWKVATSTLSDLREKAAQGRIRRVTLGLLDSTGGDGYESASEADAALAAGLIGAGLTEGEAFELFRASTRGADAYRRKGTERHAEYYLRLTIQNAATFVGPVIERPDGLRLRYAGNAPLFRIERTQPTWSH